MQGLVGRGCVQGVVGGRTAELEARARAPVGERCRERSDARRADAIPVEVEGDEVGQRTGREQVGDGGGLGVSPEEGGAQQHLRRPEQPREALGVEPAHLCSHGTVHVPHT